MVLFWIWILQCSDILRFSCLCADDNPLETNGTTACEIRSFVTLCLVSFIKEYESEALGAVDSGDDRTLITSSLATCAGADPGGAPGARPPLTTKNEAPAPKFYKTEAPEWQF